MLLAWIGRIIFPWKRRTRSRRQRRAGWWPTSPARRSARRLRAPSTRMSCRTCSTLPDYRQQSPEVAARFERIRQRPVILSVRDLDKKFGANGGARTRSSSDVSLDIHRREFITVIGPSGCGKSTFIRIVAGLDEATGGEVLLDGQAVTGPGPDRGMVFQGYTLFPWLTVKKNVMFGLEMRGQGQATPPRPRRGNGSTWSACEVRERLPAPALRRHEAARRHRPRPRQ